MGRSLILLTTFRFVKLLLEKSSLNGVGNKKPMTKTNTLKKTKP